ncbi:SusC/RagA family TonB-linked outer membrane protein [Portibacter lacus]|uniref:SusC/RagA family TonB-linked outer membrane protein n=2 Tax=Portibacter lacus TaxID=1099794 RepID=A0AA37WDQ9_9BACT|nr:SusC/RagA family TonB-linked outer membrane protein [Portibacter lacus]
MFAQSVVNGTVQSSTDNLPLIGATVVEKGTNNGTSTDIDGKFSLEVSESASLIVSYLGYKSKEVNVIGEDMMILLDDDATTLDEVVVVGYGTQKKSDLVSAVTKTDLSKAVATPTSDVTEMLRGRISGLQVEVGGGTLRPGGSSEILFRGRGSIEGNISGIYVVDGVVRTGGIEDINPDDIESVEFLKDASAQAIYGSRAVNGVVLITTKRGRTDKISVSYHGYLSSKSIERNFNVYSGEEFAQLKREATRANDADDAYPSDEDIFSETELESIANKEYVDWEEELLRKGFVNSQSIGISGGTDFTKVYASLNYFKEDGIIPTSSYRRNNLRLNVDQKITDRISTTFDLNLLNDFAERASNVNVITFSPLGRAYDDNGELVQFPSGEELTGTNPLWNLRESDHDDKGNDFVITVIPKWDITDHLQYQFKGSMTRRNSERGQYLSSLHSSGDSDFGIARIENQLRENYLIENILTYDNQINLNHKFNVTLVQAVDENKYSSTFTEGRGFTNESLGYDGITNAIGSVSVNRNKTQFRTSSYMGRARYNLLNKYMFAATMRADGASVNAAGFKWTYNPAAAFAWKIHNEAFLENVEAIDELKLRVSYGSLANALSRPYASLFTADGQNYVFDGQSASGYSPSSALPNVNLKHETITTFNVGLDFSIVKRFLQGSIEYYDSRTTDLLLRRGVPSTSGYTFTYFNAGEVQNTGIELGLKANVINTPDFRWSISTNWSNNKNKILDLYDDAEGNPITEDDTYRYYVGQPIGVIRTYQFDGIWQEGDDFENAPQANPESTDPQENLRPGDIRISDVNGVDEDGNVTNTPDGKITQEDRVFINPNPKWFGSLSSNLSYKGFDLLVDFYAVQGATKVNPFLSVFNNGGTLQGKANGVKVPYYTPENPSTTYPRPNFDSAPKYLGALAVKDASYVRLRTVKLGYTLPAAVNEKLNTEMINLYVTATNLFTQTEYLGYSPEVNIRDTFSSADSGYPDSKVWTFGLKIQL